MGSISPKPFLTHVFSETVTNTDITFYVFYPKTFLTMSHTFANFCVFPFIFYLCLFSLGVKWTPWYLPRNKNIFLNFLYISLSLLWYHEKGTLTVPWGHNDPI